MELIIKLGSQLTSREIQQINLAKNREFKAPPLSKAQLQATTHFLLVENDKIFATGELISINNIKFNSKIYNILGIGGIVANTKAQGFGKQIMTAIKKYLLEKNKSGVGFCLSKNKGFYEKCGFFVDDEAINRFVYYTGGKRITDTWDHCVFYLNSSDNFMRDVLLNPNLEIFLPRPPDW